MGVLKYFIKGLSKFSNSTSSQGRYETSPDNHLPGRGPRDQPSLPVDRRATSSNLATNQVILEEQQPPETTRTESNNVHNKDQSTPLGGNTDRNLPPSSSISKSDNITAPLPVPPGNGSISSTESHPQEDKQNIAQILIQNKRKFICASCEREVLDSVRSNKMSKCFFCNSTAERQKLSNAVKRHEREINNLRKTVKDKSREIEGLQKDLQRKEAEATNLKERVQGQAREIRSLETDYEKIKADYQKNENEIRKLQQTESAMRRQGDVLMDEQAKTLILDILRTKIKAICRIYLKDIRWKNILATVDEQQLKGVLGSTFSPSWHPESWLLIRDHPNMSTQTLVTALLSCTIAKSYFQNPFFRCGEARDALGKIYDWAILKLPEPAIVWRAKTTTLLKDVSYDNGITTVTSDIVIKRIFNTITSLIQTENPLEDDRKSDLYTKIVDLVRSSITLATDWHSREFHFEVISFEWLCFMNFDVYSEETSKFVTPFPASRKLEGGKLYGILSVISPGFIRYLKGDGEKEFKKIVWEKASVLLTENPL
ncbi:hypothetical protein TWF225_003212 [Orbilia oligospora]|nr:hypothetical protein TWF225_003212 [Orbilia oligospora]KAF3263024.1 hypothetical protein TWF128_001998 [Orbilia oligospora]KAF3267396.1 hypothetical protein TWF217_000460 [Orbilia oligospora]KAF3294413.1 hypothetical protein TWF132_003399 [Orbilia oligospora]